MKVSNLVFDLVDRKTLVKRYAWDQKTSMLGSAADAVCHHSVSELFHFDDRYGEVIFGAAHF